MGSCWVWRGRETDTILYAASRQDHSNDDGKSQTQICTTEAERGLPKQVCTEYSPVCADALYVAAG